ncbi:MAG: T9SS type A sorting domain-containing protein [Flavobacterium sp.]|uniref:GEVED domain-containing protein n=1 Tax=Flavobacterium sp. TaxID=239 RepID=UPI0011FF2259|nr:GEVED domain-containing protein [Flavobacterium sp.]RZJ66950.1 MAG: T9SS type A sorting domain-containing protein [Flavobacterium sp.]
MTKNYKCFGSDTYVWPENDVVAVVGYSPPPPDSSTKVSKMFSYLLFFLFFLISGTSVSQVSYLQNFDAGNGSWTGTFGNVTGATSCGGAGGVMRYNLWSFATSATLVSPSLGIANPASHSFSFDYKIADYSANTSGTAEGWGNFVAEWSNSTSGPWTTIATIDDSNHIVSGDCANKSYTFTPTAGALYIRFSAAWSNGDYYLNIDNVNVAEISNTAPACPTVFTPANAATGVIRNSSLTWSGATGGPTNYDVYFGTSPSPAFVANVTTASYTPAVMTPNTVYYWRVVSKNAIGDATGCIDNSFTSGGASALNYCTPVTTLGCTDGDVIARVILNTLDNNSGTGCPSGTLGYSNYTANTALTTTLQAGSSYGCTVYAGQYAEGYAAWIDYNDDGTFAANERIGYSNGTVAGSGVVGQLGSSATFPIVLSCSPPLGSHVLRVRAMFATSGIDVTACGNNTYGEVEDYLVTISAADPCPIPNTLAANTVTDTSATLTWNAGCVETNWEVVYQLAGSGAPTGAGTAVTTNSLAVSGLTSGQVYEFYVRANCLANGFSSWVGPYIFTAPACSTLLTPVDGATNVSLAAGFAALTWTASPGATSYAVYWGTSPTTLASIGTVTGPAANVNNILYGTTYYWTIAPTNVNGPRLGCTVFSFTTEAAPADDLCATATSLNALTSPVSGSTMGLADNYSPSCNSTSVGDIGPDKFYSITVPANYTLVMGLTASNYDSVHSIFYGSCTTQTELFCSDTEIVNHTWVNNTGETQTVYWVQDSWYTGTGTFTLAWTLTPPPVAVASFVPASVCGQAGGTTVTVTGSNFLGTTAVTFNGIAATSFSVTNDTTLTAVVPAGNVAGPIAVTSAPSSNGTGTSANSLIVYTPPVVEEITNGNATLCVDGTVDLDSASPGGIWASLNPAVATVDSAGVVTAESAGAATISYSVTDNGCTTSVTTVINVNAPVSSPAPADQSVVSGSTAVFSVAATGGISGYQWQVSVDGGDNYDDVVDGSSYSGSITNTLTITNTPSSFNENMYRVVISGLAPCPAVTTQGANLLVGDVGIVTPPQPVTLCASGTGMATFTVVTSGVVTDYAWEVFQTSTWLPISDTTVGSVTYSGSDTNQLTVTGLGIANSGWQFRAVVTGFGDPLYSSGALLTINQGPAITSDPVTTGVCYSGGSATFTATATNASGYAWQYSTDNLSFTAVSNGTPAGATYTNAATASLTVTTTAATPNTGTYFYRATALGLGDCPAVNSASAQLTFTTPAITSQPVASVVSNGASTTFTVATSAPSPSYQWQYATSASGPWNSVATGTPSGLTYSNDTTATLTVAAGTGSVTSTARYYRAVVTSNGCSVNSNAAQLSVLAYCTPTVATNTASYFSNITTTGGLTNINNNSVFSTNGYGTYLNLSASQYLNQPISFTTTIAGPTVGIAVWVDWNQNGSFETTERVANTTGYISTFGATFTVPATALPGNTRMRFMVDFNNSNPSNPCVMGTRAEVEDYSFTVITPPACTGNPVAGTVSTSMTSVCGSGAVTLSVSAYPTAVSGISYQWYNVATGAISGATGMTYTTPVLTAETSYFVRTICASGGFTDSNTVTISISNPSLTSTTPASRCGLGTVTLSGTASAGSSVVWYAGSTGGTPLFTGDNFTTPAISATTTYYAEAATVLGSGTAGATGNAVSNNGTSVGSHGIAFTTTSPNLTINSVRIPFTGTGTITLLLRNSTNTTTLGTFTTGTVTGTGLTPLQIPVNINVSTAGSYLLLVSAISGTVGGLGYSTATFPSSTLGGAFTVTGGYWFGATTSNMYLYQLGVAARCATARTAVVATVNTPPALTLSSTSATICAGASTSAVTVTSNAADYDTYTWSPSAGVTGSAASGFVFNPTATTTYTLTTANAAGCGNSTTFTVTVNPLPGAITLTPASPSVCSVGAAVQLTAVVNNPVPSGGCLTAPSGQYPGTAFTATACNGTTTNTITGAAWAGEYSVVNVSANTSYVFTSTGAGDYVTISNAAGTTVLAAGPSPVSYVSIAAGQVRFYTHTNAACGAATVSRTRSFVCSPLNTPVVWSPSAGLFTDAAATVPYTGTAASSVYAKPTATTTYSAVYTTAAGCTSTAQTTVSFSAATTWYVDADNDNYGDSALPTVQACTEPALYAAVGGDCNDSVAAVNPGATEVAFNGVDDNCNGTIDEGSQIMSQVLASQCGTTLAAINSAIGAVSFPAPVDGYRFRVVNTTTNAVQTIDRTQPNFQLTALATYDYATTYSISVMVRRNGVWLNYYGPSCLVSTPAVLDPGGAASVTPSQCGITLTNISTLIATTSLQGVTGYRFRVTNTTDPTAPNQVQELDRATHWFSLPMLATYAYGTTYTVEVALKTGSSTTYSGYGAPCTITTPAVPVITNPGTATTPAMLFYTTSMNRATSYRFQLGLMVAPFTTIIVDRTSHYFSFSNVPGYVPGGQYAVQVAVMTAGTWSPFGEAELITAPGATRGLFEEETGPSIAFRAVVYPNPYAEGFYLDMDTPSDERVNVKVYDMVGKLLEDSDLEVDAIELQRFGVRYPSGVYNMIVTQGDFVKTLRVIKR